MNTYTFRRPPPDSPPGLVRGMTQRDFLIRALGKVKEAVLDGYDRGEEISIHEHTVTTPVYDDPAKRLAGFRPDDFRFDGVTFAFSVGRYPRKEPA